MNTFNYEAFLQTPIIGILRGFPEEICLRLLDTYRGAGLNTIEITMNTAGAKDIIARAVKEYGSDLNVGAGTVCSQEDLDAALQAGARFIVTPVLHTGIIRRCKELGVPVFPGAYTPSEIHAAWEAGATMVKVFPAGMLGPEYIKQVKAPLNSIKLLPTGGVSLENMEAYLKAGASGFGLGGSLFRESLIARGAWPELEVHFRKYHDFWRQRA